MRWITLLALVFALIACTPTDETVDEVVADTSETSVVTGAYGERLDDYLSALEIWGFSGVGLVVKGDEVLLAKGYGLCDRETRRPCDTESVFTVGSITKPFTGAAVLALVEQGELGLDDTLADHFDAVPEDKAGITLHQLLTHSAGFPGGLGPDFEAIDREAYVELAFSTPLQYAPGDGYDYSNTGYSLLGAILERHTGDSYEQVLRREVLEPAGMTDTGYLLPAWDADRVAQGYRGGEAWGTVLERPWADDGPFWHLRANGGLHSTSGDMRRWFDVLRTDVVLNEASRELWITPHVDEGYGDSYYGYGLVVHDTDWGQWIAHNGGNSIFAADHFWRPEDDFYVFVASNSSLVRVDNLREDMLATLFDDAPLPDVHADSLLPQDTDPLLATQRAGTYQLAGETVEVTVDDVRLLVRPRSQATFSALAGNDPTAAERNATTSAIFRKLLEGSPEPYAGLPGDPARVTRSNEGMPHLIENRGCETIDLIATVPAGDGASITWGHAICADDREVAVGLRFADNGDYLGTHLGNPATALPSITLAPLSNDRYQGRLNGTAASIPVLSVDGDCLVGGNVSGDEVRMCRSSIAP